MTKIDIFSGFLGAGKTTLIKKLIAEAYTGEKLVLIENEFGEISVDGGFLKDAGVEITEMSSGCICCSLVGDFAEALKKVKTQFAPDRILIEPSGVGKLSDVIRAVQGVGDPDLVPGSFTTVVDATRAKMYMKNFGEFWCNQVENAGAIVLSRTKGMSEGKLAACVSTTRTPSSSPRPGTSWTARPSAPPWSTRTASRPSSTASPPSTAMPTTTMTSAAAATTTTTSTITTTRTARSAPAATIMTMTMTMTMSTSTSMSMTTSIITTITTATTRTRCS